MFRTFGFERQHSRRIRQANNPLKVEQAISTVSFAWEIFAYIRAQQLTRQALLASITLPHTGFHV